MRRFKTPNRNQLMLFPPNLNDWVSGNHPARFVVDFVETLDLSRFYAKYGENGDGQPPYDPKMMIAILLYANMLGILSSRKIERVLEDDIGFRYITCGLKPDHDTIAEFRRSHCTHLKDVFVACVRLGIKAGMIGLTHVAIDGTKVQANAAQSARKTKEQVEQEIQHLERLVGSYLDDSERIDHEEDKQFGKGNNGYLLPDFLSDPDGRKEWIKKELEELKPRPEQEKTRGKEPPESPATRKLKKKLKGLRRAKAALEGKEKKRKEEDPTGKRERDAQRKRGTPYVPKVNTTDPDSQTMLFREGGYKDGFNGQIAVDNETGMIVAADITQDANDVRQLSPMLLQVQANTEWLPENVSADNGYFNLEHMGDRRFKSVEFYIPPRARSKSESDTSKSEQMRNKLETDIGKAVYLARQAIVEPVFGVIKHARKFRQFLTRGKEMVKAEWMLICTAHNLLKLHQSGLAFS
jgi:transposase